MVLAITVRYNLHTSQVLVAHQAGAYPSFCSMKWLGIFLLPTPSFKFASTHLYIWWREALRVDCLALEHNTMSLARVWTRTTQSRVERIYHEATVPPILAIVISVNSPWHLLCNVTSLDLLDESQTKLSSDLLDSRQSISQIQVQNARGNVCVTPVLFFFKVFWKILQRLS